MRSVELFAGAGGLALGIEAAGFHHDTVIERNKYCCDTIRENQQRGFKALEGWRLHPGDVKGFDYRTIKGQVSLLAGGPPCQPFSIGGKHRAYEDDRDMFPEVVRAIRELQPQAILIENVKGLTRKSFINYFNYIIDQLTYPELGKKSGEDWTRHRDRLERHKTKGSGSGLKYTIVPRLLNAANYGVPQKRERVFFVGFRSDIHVEWTFPDETHSLDDLLLSQWVTGKYWERHKVSKKRRPAPPDRLRKRIDELSATQSLFDPPKLPWRTVRDAISELPDPETEDCSAFLNHRHNSGARTYVGHTGSLFDEPAKTLKAGDHGVPGGENIVVFPDGRVRYFTVREAACIQTFPKDYAFQGAWTEAMRPIGNAVPVDLAKAVAKKIAAILQLAPGRSQAVIA